MSAEFNTSAGHGSDALSLALSHCWVEW